MQRNSQPIDDNLYKVHRSKFELKSLHYINLWKLRGAYNKFSDIFFFVWAFKIVVDTWTFSILLLYVLWDDGLIFMISRSNEQLQQQLEYTLLNPDCYSW